MEVDWSRLAEPQEDQYDTRMALQFMATRICPEHPRPYVRRPVGQAPTIFDGQVAVRYIAPQCPGHPRNRNGPLRHPNIDHAVNLMRRWPTLYEQFKALMDSFHPMVDVSVPLEEWGRRVGSNSHADEWQFGTMYATIYDPVALAEAFAHEMAHNKLRAYGVYVEKAYALVTNPPDELYESPIRKDILRPMTAVLHAQYSFIHVLALDLKMIPPETDPQILDHMLTLLSWNVPRMEQGYDELNRNIRVDANGRKFLDAFNAWSLRVIEEGNRVLQAHGKAKLDLSGQPRPPAPTQVRQAAPAGHVD
ncbi:MAG TPA: HEXXH motif-containing putative peptide modification protein [Candidatus Nitrosotenuis sp.]|nr:HEXXH motif-containing putative peptide modification protein [Candidatus Nitrosotenuis sp.]